MQKYAVCLDEISMLYIHFYERFMQSVLFPNWLWMVIMLCQQVFCQKAVCRFQLSEKLINNKSALPQSSHNLAHVLTDLIKDCAWLQTNWNACNIQQERSYMGHQLIAWGFILKKSTMTLTNPTLLLKACWAPQLFNNGCGDSAATSLLESERLQRHWSLSW